MTQSSDDPSQRDIAWVGYHPRAAAPSFAVAAVATVLVLSGRWYPAGLSQRAGAWAVFALAWAVWPGLVIIFLYRTVTFTYRLTDRALLVDYGFFSYPVSPIPLCDITGIRTGGGWLTRAIGVGCVEVQTKDRSFRLTGVRCPDAFVDKIQSEVKKSKSDVRPSS